MWFFLHNSLLSSGNTGNIFLQCVATLLHCKLKPSVARITTCVANLFRDKTHCCKFSESCAYDWSVVCKQRWRLLNSFSVGRERLPLSVWAFRTAKTRKGVENEIVCDSSSKPFSFCSLF